MLKSIKKMAEYSEIETQENQSNICHNPDKKYLLWSISMIYFSKNYHQNNRNE